VTASFLCTFGEDLTPEDYRSLEARFIHAELADAAGIRRVDSYTGREMFGRRKGEMAGLIIPNVWLGESHPREYRLKLDHPELETRADGTVRVKGKYIQPSGRPNLLYFPPGMPEAMLTDTSVKMVFTEGEFKGLASWRAANHNSPAPRFGVIATAGVWNFWGVVGKAGGPNGERLDVKGVIPDIERITWKGRRVIIAFDADLQKNPRVRAARWKLTTALLDRGASVANLEWPIEEGKGIDDRLRAIGPERVLADIEAVVFGGWQSQLLRNKETDKFLPCYENVALFLEHSPEWAGVIAYNEFTGGYHVLRQAPAPVTARTGDEIEDHFDVEATRWLERHGVFVKPNVVRLVVDAIARRNPFHPVKEFLESLPEWDGKSRIESWLIDYCGVESSDANPNQYARAVGACWLRSAVARILQPGCKADHMLVLEGEQGIGKSTAARILAGEWFTDQLSNMDTKDASMQLRGAWFIELSELGTLGRADAAKEKAFLTQQEERFRLPYGKRLVHVPRQCVFIGTTNADSWLKDETGGRRFWPVRCRGQIKLKELQDDRDQLWAEALHSYRAGGKWYLDDNAVVASAIEQQKQRYETDVWQPVIEAWLRQPTQRDDEEGHAVGTFTSRTDSVTIDDVLAHAVGKRLDQWTQGDKNRIARCLRSLGWERYRAGTGTDREWRYRKVVSQ